MTATLPRLRVIRHVVSCGQSAAVFLSIAAFGATVPRLPQLFPGAQVARYLRAVDCTPFLVTAGYHEPSLVFLAGTATHQSNATGAADFLLAGGCRFAIVERAQERAFVQRAEAIGLR